MLLASYFVNSATHVFLLEGDRTIAILSYSGFLVEWQD